QGEGKKGCQDQSERHQEFAGAVRVGEAAQPSDEISSKESAQCAAAVHQRKDLAGVLARDAVGNDGEEWRIGCIHRSAGKDQTGKGQPETDRREEKRAHHGNSTHHKERPDERSGAAGAVRDMAHAHLSRNGEQIGCGGEQSGRAERESGRLMNDGGEPEDEAIYSKAPKNVLRAKDQNIAAEKHGEERGGGLARKLRRGLLLRDSGLKFGGLGRIEPTRLAGAVAYCGDPDGAPEDCGQSLNDESTLPAKVLGQETGDG